VDARAHERGSEQPQPQSTKLTPEALGLTGRLYSIKEAQAILGIRRTKLYYLTRDSKLPSIRIDGRTLYASADLVAFINERREA
jgi:hypothetical protein